MDQDSLELLLAQGLSVEKIATRFGKHPSTVSYWMAKHGLEALGREKHAAKGGISRQRLERLVDAGATTAEIAAAVGLSQGTVRHWLQRYGPHAEHSGPEGGGREGLQGSRFVPRDDDVCATRRDRIRHRRSWVLPLQAMPVREGGSSAAITRRSGEMRVPVCELPR